MILLSGVLGEGGDGVQITQRAMTVFFGGAGTYFVAIALFFFAFTTILGNYSYAENNLLYLGGGRWSLLALRLAALALAVGSLAGVAWMLWQHPTRRASAWQHTLQQLASITVPETAKSMLAVTSDSFQLTATAGYLESGFVLTSILKINENKQVKVLARRFGGQG